MDLQSSAPSDWPRPVESGHKVDLLLLTAVAAEFTVVAPFFSDGRVEFLENRRCRIGEFGGRNAALSQMGIGPSAARHAVESVLNHFRPRQVLLLGFSGGLAHPLHAGDAVVGERVARIDGDQLVGTWPLSRLSVPFAVSGTLLSANQLISTPQRKRELFEYTGALAVDMETATVAEVCEKWEIPLLVARTISDPSDEMLEQVLLKMLLPSGDLSWPRVATTIMRHPGCIAGLVQMQKNVRRATANLRQLVAWFARKYGEGEFLTWSDNKDRPETGPDKRPKTS